MIDYTINESIFEFGNEAIKSTDFVMPDQGEIAKRMRVLWSPDCEPEVEGHEMVLFLDHAHVTEFIDTDEQSWERIQKPLDRRYIISQIYDFMGPCFAASRAGEIEPICHSIQRMAAWLWLCGEDDLSRRFYQAAGDTESGYQGVDATALFELCEYFGWESRAWEKPETATLESATLPRNKEEFMTMPAGLLLDVMARDGAQLVKQVLKGEDGQPRAAIIAIDGPAETQQLLALITALQTAWQNAATPEAPALILPNHLNGA